MDVNMSLLSPNTTIRHRRPTVQEVVRDFDAFNKTVDEVSEEKRAAGGFLASLSFLIIAALVFGELRNYFYGDEGHYYRFSVDTAFSEHPELELDMIVATPCTNLMAHLTGTTSHEFSSMNEFKHDPTRFEFTEKEAMYWNELKKVQHRTKEGTTLFKSLDEMTFISGQVEEGLKNEAETKQREEAHAIQLEKKKNPKESMDGGMLILIGNGFNVFHVVASNSEKNEGTACRIHGRMRVNKVKGDSFVVSTGKGLGVDGIFAHFGGVSNPGNLSHRIERFNFGPTIYGLVTPLAGIEQISETGIDEFRYFLKVVPTRIYHSGLFGGSTLTYQYSVTFMKKTPKKDVHKHAAIIIHYEFAATVIEVRRIQSSLLQMLIRLCSAVGGVFATSVLLNSICVRVLTVLAGVSERAKIQLIDSQLGIEQPGVVVDT
ncbi:Endoplasmic reticulum vesicle transporter family protein [Brugia pahangi]